MAKSRQKTHLLKSSRSVFYNRGNNKKSHKRVDALEEKLHRAKQHRFLFLPSQYINKPIQHLKYHKRLVLRDEKYYNFPIPPDSVGTQAAVAISAILDPPLRLCPGNDSTSTLNTHSPATTSQPIPIKDENTWHDKLGIWVPNDLFPYVTDEPVYISKRQAKLKGQQHVPGTVRQQKDRDASEAARLSYEAELSARAKLWGTSSNSIEYREDMVKDLSNFQEHYHKKITPLTDHRAVLQNRLKKGKSVYKTTKQLSQLDHELGLFTIDYFSVMNKRDYHYRYKGLTSDDTKQLELRLHKRSSILTTDIDRHVTHIKKLRLDILSPEDFKVFTSS
ncbi:hypothetical protein RhiirA5_433751 [Rhizophagus irregularis]|uniref:DUF8211 domain-containing protein n=1 Tax=Rhizophagus irregularis TaxID=588596 RepID=A0A2N0NR81_9GLOM|nr:hypothetical protein RhiirA5_433751 [Rhizophagus irregularis]